MKESSSLFEGESATGSINRGSPPPTGNGNTQARSNRGCLSGLKRRWPFLGTKKGIALFIFLGLLVIAVGLSGLAALKKGKGEGGPSRALAKDVIKDDAHFYGQSPPVYPSPEMSGSGDWSTAYSKAKALVDKMTLDEKIGLSGGVSGNGCDGRVGDIERLDFPGLCLCDAGQGLRNTDLVNSYPSGIHVGASWNKELARKRAVSMAGEFKTKGVNVLLGPVVGPSGRIQRGGRNWEGFSIDPYLSGALAYETVTGIQDAGVIASTKHYIGNEQETNRNPYGDIESVSSNIDDRTMHELYLWPFQDAVKAGTGSVMCSYNRLNNSYACANSKSQNGLLKDELGFQGFVVSDWNAQHTGYASALAGLDLAMPSGRGYWEGKLRQAVENGTVPESRVTDMAVRILAPWFRMQQDNRSAFPAVAVGRRVTDLSQQHVLVDARTAEARPVLLDGAIEGHVLVKNVNKTLPLTKPRLVSLFGYSAKAWDTYNQNGGGVTDPFALGAQPLVNGADVVAGFTGNPRLQHPAIGLNGTLISGGGSGATAPSLLVSPFEAVKARADEAGAAVFWDFAPGSTGPKVDYVTDACVVFGNAWASESYDRPGLGDDYTDELINHVASQCRSTIVVLHNAGVRLVDGFVDHPNVTAVIMAHLPGQDSGMAVAALLFGDANPSGKLPYTVARKAGDYGGMEDPDLPEGKYELFPQSDFDEGVFVDYRRFDREDIEPRYPFGFGLSYTTFEYANLQVSMSSGNGTTTTTTTTVDDEYPSGKVVEGGMEDLWDVVVTVRADVRNVGDRDGAEVAQLYIGIPGDDDDDVPAKQLRGFEKPSLDAGEETTVEFQLTRRDLSVWDVEKQLWRLRRGSYKVFVGGSSRDLPLSDEFAI